MKLNSSTAIQKFQNHVAVPFQLYNSLLTSLPFNRIEKTCILLSLLQQLGRTPFIKKQKPTPFDEAVSLIWYPENVFYNAVGKIVSDLNNFYEENFTPIKMGFWSGGDRDGNPFVTVEATLQVAATLRDSIRRWSAGADSPCKLPWDILTSKRRKFTRMSKTKICSGS